MSGQAELFKRDPVATAVEGPLVCVAVNELGVRSETFIRNHITRLGLPVCVLHGSPLIKDENGREVNAEFSQIVRCAVDKLGRMAGKKTDYQRQLDRAVAHHLRRRGVAVVLAEYGLNGVAMMDACAMAGVPLVAHFHGYDAYRTGTLQGIGKQYPRMFAQAAGIVAVSRHMRDQLVRLGAPPEKLHTIPYGIDAGIFARADPAAAPPHFIAVGRFVEKKAPHLLVVAMARVIGEFPGATLEMIGDGPLLSPCRQLAAALGVSHAIQFRGACEQSEVAAAMRKARAFVQHSIVASDGDCEGTPCSILEAQVTGLPVIATRHTGIVDAVVDGKTGFLVDEQDVQSMAGYMVRLARGPQEAGAMGREARVFATENFSIERQTGQLADVLRKVSRAPHS